MSPNTGPPGICFLLRLGHVIFLASPPHCSTTLGSTGCHPACMHFATPSQNDQQPHSQYVGHSTVLPSGQPGALSLFTPSVTQHRSSEESDGNSEQGRRAVDFQTFHCSVPFPSRILVITWSAGFYVVYFFVMASSWFPAPIVSSVPMNIFCSETLCIKSGPVQ